MRKRAIIFGGIILYFVLVYAVCFAPKDSSAPSASDSEADAPTKPEPPLKPVTARELADRAAEAKSARVNAAHALEEGYLDKGYDISVSVSGKEKDVITFKYALISRPIVHFIQKDGHLLDRLRQLGFRKAYFGDGWHDRWRFDLK